jgi:hypothetical protein
MGVEVSSGGYSTKELPMHSTRAIAHGAPRLIASAALLAMITACAQASKPAPTSTAPTDAATQVTLARTACFGACPTFTLTVDSDGQATLSLPSMPAASAKQADDANGPLPAIVLQGTIAAAKVQSLLRTLREGQFTQLDADYSASITDMPSTVITVRQATGTHATRVYAVPCASQAAKDGSDPAMGPAKPVPDVFCQAQTQLDAMACTVYAGALHTLPRDRQPRVPPRCQR